MNCEACLLIKRELGIPSTLLSNVSIFHTSFHSI
uniref:Uncharacterized protein n=1 Tax=Rhizophora mucronata TaxID=61149 RepID=A0A2P2NM67_RHIMU